MLGACGMTTCAKYRRISDDREGLEAGVLRQDEDLDSLASAHGLTIVADYSDNDIGASTRSRKARPGFAAMIADARAGRFAVIICYSSSRLTRRPREHEDLIDLAERHGIRFLFVRSPSFDLNTADGKNVARILASNDAAESERMAERVARAARTRAEQGKPHGGARRYGFYTDGAESIERNDLELTAKIKAEGLVVVELTRRVIAGESCRGLARDLRERGEPSPRGGQWCARVVKELVCRARNCGKREHKGEIYDGDTATALVTVDEWQAARAVLLDPARGVWRGGTVVSTGAGIYTCWCGGRIASGAHSTYVGASCSHVKRSRVRTDKVVERYVLAKLAADGVKVPAHKAPRAQDAEAKVLTIKRQIENLEDQLADELIDEPAYRRQRDRKARQLLAAQAQRVTTARPSPLAGVSAETWSGLSLDRRRAVVEFLATVTLVKAGSPGSIGRTGVRIDPRQLPQDNVAQI
jgi:site-specific DNA recombinase